MDEAIFPIKKSYWVVPGRFRAGEYPGSIFPEEARKKIRWLLDQDIDLFIDLTEPGEYDLKPYKDTLVALAAKKHKTAIHRRMAIKDCSVPSMELLIEILNLIDSALATGSNIYLHCLAGKGRTGLVVGCYLARHGMPGSLALQEIQEMRHDVPDAIKPSPEYAEQIRMVEQWIPGI